MALVMEPNPLNPSIFHQPHLNRTPMAPVGLGFFPPLGESPARFVGRAHDGEEDVPGPGGLRQADNHWEAPGALLGGGFGGVEWGG